MSSDGYARVHTDASSSGPRVGRLVAVAIGLGAIISVAAYLNTHHAYRCSDLDALGPHSCAIQSRRKAAEASLSTALSACEWNVTAVSYRFAMEQKQFYDKTAEERATTRRLCVSGEYGSQTKAANALRMQGVPISNVAKWKVRGGFPE